MGRIVIKVDRSRELPLPSGARLIHRNVQKLAGIYDLAKVEPWLSEAQRDGRSVTGEHLLELLEHTQLIRRCLGWADGAAIKAKGYDPFCRVFGQETTVILFGSAVRGGEAGSSGSVPTLSSNGKFLNQGWYPLSHAMGNVCPVALFPPVSHK